MVSSDAKEYLEIDLREAFVITGARTQGRFGNGQGQEYAEDYKLDYWRPGFTKWARWKNRNGKEVGNILDVSRRIIDEKESSGANELCIIKNNWFKSPTNYSQNILRGK